MATFDQIRPARPFALGAVFSNLLGSVIAWNEHRSTVKALSGLTARELEDIGLTRADIENFATVRR